LSNNILNIQNHNGLGESMEDNTDNEATINEYETPWSSFINVSSSQNQRLSDPNGASSNNSKRSSRSNGLVQGLMTSNSAGNKFVNDLDINFDSLTLGSNDSTPTMREKSPNSRVSKITTDVNDEISGDVSRVRQLIIK
jgi:hypothetical protein